MTTFFNNCHRAKQSIMSRNFKKVVGDRGIEPTVSTCDATRPNR